MMVGLRREDALCRTKCSVSVADERGMLVSIRLLLG